MDTPLPEPTRTGTRPPRYAGEKPLPDRTQQNDESALRIAELALNAKEKRRQKSGGNRLGGTENDPGHECEQKLEHNIEFGQQTSSVQVERHKAVPGSCAQETREHAAGSSLESQHQVFGDVPHVRLPLKSMYDGTGDWPKRVPAGGNAVLMEWDRLPP